MSKSFIDLQLFAPAGMNFTVNISFDDGVESVSFLDSSYYTTVTSISESTKSPVYIHGEYLSEFWLSCTINLKDGYELDLTNSTSDTNVTFDGTTVKCTYCSQNITIATKQVGGGTVR